jgi:hypothetical protein
MKYSKSIPLVLAVAGAVALGAAQPRAVEAQYANQPGCATTAPQPPQLVSPPDGAQYVSVRPNWVKLQVSLEAGAPALDEQRLVVSDGKYLTEGGTLRLDNAVVQPMDLQPGADRVVMAWLPALRENTRYDVRILLPNAGNCVYATLGSFTTGPAV